MVVYKKPTMRYEDIYIFVLAQLITKTLRNNYINYIVIGNNLFIFVKKGGGENGFSQSKKAATSRYAKALRIV